MGWAKQCSRNEREQKKVEDRAVELIESDNKEKINWKWVESQKPTGHL